MGGGVKMRYEEGEGGVRCEVSQSNLHKNINPGTVSESICQAIENIWHGYPYDNFVEKYITTLYVIKVQKSHQVYWIIHFLSIQCQFTIFIPHFVCYIIRSFHLNFPSILLE